MPRGSLYSELIYGNPAAGPSDAGFAGAPPQVFAVQLQVQRLTIESAGATGNLKEVGRGLDLLVGTAQPDFSGLLTTLDGLPSLTDVRGVLTQLNPAAYAELFRLSLLRLEDVQKPISDRLTIVGAASVSGGVREVLAAAAGGGGEWSAWTNAFGSSSSLEADASRGFGGYSRSEAGDVTGLERRFGRLTIGLIGAKGGGSAQLRSPAAAVSSDTWHLGGYVSLPIADRIFADASAFFGEALNTIKRTQNLPGGTVSSRSSVYGNEWMLQTGLGMQMASQTSSWSLVPTIRVAYAGSRQGGARETGAGAFDIRTDSRTSGTVLLKSGIEGAKEWRIAGIPLRMSGNLEWLHDFDADPRRLGVRWEGALSAPWTLSGAPGRVDMFKLGMSFDVGLSNTATVRVYGEHEFLKKGPATYFGICYSIGF
ncbi:MAG: autotransporter outer membrane beta-barrel domain-containing protein [Verrucomicrobiota bacterium]